MCAKLLLCVAILCKKRAGSIGQIHLVIQIIAGIICGLQWLKFHDTIAGRARCWPGTKWRWWVRQSVWKLTIENWTLDGDSTSTERHNRMDNYSLQRPAIVCTTGCQLRCIDRRIRSYAQWPATRWRPPATESLQRYGRSVPKGANA